MAYIKKKGEIIGKGCYVQVLGIVACFFFFPLGLIAGISIMAIGGLMAIKYVCSECQNKVEKGSRLCPTCKAEFKK